MDHLFGEPVKDVARKKQLHFKHFLEAIVPLVMISIVVFADAEQQILLIDKLTIGHASVQVAQMIARNLLHSFLCLHELQL